MRNESKGIISKGSIDATLLFTVIFLIAFGIIMVYSSSSYYSLGMFGKNTYFLRRHLMWVGAGIFVLALVSFINYRYIFAFWPLYYLASLGLLVYVFLFGEKNYGASRWIRITSSISFQPSELAKVLLLIAFSVSIAMYADYIVKIKYSIIFLVLAAIPVALIGIEDYSTSFIVLASFAGMYFIANRAIYIQLLGILPIGGISLFALYSLKGYREARINIWMNGPLSDPTGDGYQILQSFYAIGAGGFFGVGLGKSIQKMGSLPFAYNDVIFAIICEELGLFGGFTILVLFGFLIYRLFDLSMATDDLVARLFLIGLMVQIAAQVFIHIGVTTNAVPATGIPLPFISYGGTALFVILAELGIALNISRDINSKMYKG